jgi:hypothetical protein
LDELSMNVFASSIPIELKLVTAAASSELSGVFLHLLIRVVQWTTVFDGGLRRSFTTPGVELTVHDSRTRIADNEQAERDEGGDQRHLASNDARNLLPVSTISLARSELRRRDT